MVMRWLFGGDDDESEIVNEDGDWVVKDSKGNVIREADNDDRERTFKHLNNESKAEQEGWNKPNPDTIDDQSWW